MLGIPFSLLNSVHQGRAYLVMLRVSSSSQWCSMHIIAHTKWNRHIGSCAHKDKECVHAITSCTSRVTFLRVCVSWDPLWIVWTPFSYTLKSSNGSDQNLMDPLNYTRHGMPKSFFRTSDTLYFWVSHPLAAPACF